MLLVFLCVLHALEAGRYADFYPINGTFQNYNPVRRLLAGQVPYKDFNDYLGLGHLYTGTIMTVFFGGDYQGSLQAFSFLTLSAVAALSVMLGRTVFNDWKVTLGATNIILIMLFIQPLFFINGVGLTSELRDSLNSALGVGNSARFIRGMILPLNVALFRILLKLYEKSSIFKGDKLREYVPVIGVGGLAGFSFSWSNDYGICCFVCGIIMIFWTSLSRKRRIKAVLLDVVVGIIAALISLRVFVEILTLGHFHEWFNNTFGTGGYQAWYYNSSKSYYIYDVDFSCLVLIQAFIAVAYLLCLYLKKGTKEAIIRYGIPGFVNMTAFCAINEYQLLSGGGAREVAFSVLFITIIFEAANLLGCLSGNALLRDGVLVTSLIVSLAWSVSTVKEELLFWCTADKSGKYVASMGGNMTNLYTDMEAASKFLDGEAFFSTYASGQEVVEGKFQPSGTDYIIHVLGDKQREKYLHDFRNSEFEYAATIRKEFTDWEYWVERANWFFYRELYQHWHPVFANSYELYWKRNDRENEFTLVANYDVKVERINESAVKLSIQTDEHVQGIADLYIDYSVDKKTDSGLAQFLFQRQLKVENTGAVMASDGYFESNYLRSSGAEYVPMTVTNGYGELMLTACPSKSTTLNLKKVECNSIYTADLNANSGDSDNK